MMEPLCPRCRKPVAYEDALKDGGECPHCGQAIVWSVPYGAISGGSFRASRAGPRWEVRTDYCPRCRKDRPYTSITHKSRMCDECVAKHPKSAARLAGLSLRRR